MHLAVFSICYRAVFIASEVSQFLTVCSVVATLVFLRGFSFNVIFFNGIECVFLVGLSRDLSWRKIWLLFTPCWAIALQAHLCAIVRDYRKCPSAPFKISGDARTPPTVLRQVLLRRSIRQLSWKSGFLCMVQTTMQLTHAPLKCSLPPSYQIAHALTKYFVQKSIRPA